MWVFFPPLSYFPSLAGDSFLLILIEWMEAYIPRQEFRTYGVSFLRIALEVPDGESVSFFLILTRGIPESTG